MKLIVILSSILFLTACASFNLSKTPKVTTTVIEVEAPKVILEPRYIGDPLSDFDIELINKMENVPDAGHRHVTKWLDYFQSRGRKHMQRYLTRSTRYLPLMKQILKQEGVPEDLVYISLIESGFSSKAYSHASAVGYWQFIRPTGKRYNLKISTFVDERRDPVESTRAAAHYFKALYNMFGDWHLSMAAYNRGESGVKRTLRRHRGRTFWDINRRRRLPAETRNYVPKFLAAKLIAYNPERFGFKNLEYQDEISFDSVQISNHVDLKKLAKKINLPYDEIKTLNPVAISSYLPKYKGDKSVVRVPKGYGIAAAGVLDQVVGKAPRYIAGHSFTYKVRRGDSLYKIARKHGTTITKLRHENGLSRRSILRIGKRIRIPQRRVRVRGKRTKKNYVAKEGYYKVRSGDSLYTIARRFRTSINKLRKLNQLGRRSLIKPGMMLLVKDVNMRPKKSRTTASEKQIASNSKSKGFKWHKVRRGQNLDLLARRYRTSIAQIKQVNGLRSSRINIGQRIKIPITGVSTVHVVRRGETLTHIARRYRITLAQLRAHNSIRNASKIFAGKKLVIPE